MYDMREEDYTLSKEEAIEAMKHNEGVALQHKLFDEDEYLYYDGEVIRNEKGSNFEDFTGPNSGLRKRTAYEWQYGWYFNPLIKIEIRRD